MDDATGAPAHAARPSPRAPSPAAPRRRKRALVGPGIVLAAAAAGTVLVSTVDPNEPGHYPTCPFLWATGLYCPGCGGLRMVHSLTHGRVAEAFGLNPMLFLLLPVFGYLWARWAACAATGVPFASRLTRPRVIHAFLALVVVYWIVRNTAFGAALAP
ncbi:hypothetical protein Arub01_14540 [Actinomadura rubrobrunea]|uniref:DUF2752 domain-containing protein n=1 Tax=Actinomadura rubrobrunea TaxID=115335 RepID=A0A9W6PT76_9ACTN|nr:DUF2752 domain-containing protein [Actinomadura rubrobrunea]GLW63210.1 hypothetical protein Arub01_14540 [Actinomadura rubrobrunea]